MLIALRGGPRGAPVSGWAAPWALGFRPFYLLAATWSALVVPIWVLQLAGVLHSTHLGMQWHAHEMVFGVATAVIAGFLLTAVRTWTGQPTPSGAPLAALAALWVLGRILALTAWGLATAFVVVAFPACVALAIAIPIIRARNLRNAMFVLALLGLAVAAGLTHHAFLAPGGWSPARGLQLGLGVVLLLITLVMGRVVPMFTNNGVPGANAQRLPAVERAVIALTAALVAVDAALPGSGWVVPLALAGAVAHGFRLALWKPWRAVGTPLVWILHASALWIVVHLLLRAAAWHGVVALPLALHALTVGVIGGAVLGMMTRTARGHTGRPILADRADIVLFVLVQVAAIMRLAGALTSGQGYLGTVVAAGCCWSGAFALYAIRYAGPLCTPRLDGKPG